MSPLYTAGRLYERHKRNCPDSQLSLRAIRSAVRSGELPSIRAGNRRLVSWDVFSEWLKGGRHAP